MSLSHIQYFFLYCTVPIYFIQIHIYRFFSRVAWAQRRSCPITQHTTEHSLNERRTLLKETGKRHLSTVRMVWSHHSYSFSPGRGPFSTLIFIYNPTGLVYEWARLSLSLFRIVFTPHRRPYKYMYPPTHVASSLSSPLFLYEVVCTMYLRM